ncbi:predicted protein [Chaetoceros tenuissimus]|uniref:PH domain-containing protein n=1 Tax=Chaetoceros tenuissimus TaxID=426638 RepID=A0AAD3DA99_9STRA|nr:predicted protein [Chaetoceros tenuissimus]
MISSQLSFQPRKCAWSNKFISRRKDVLEEEENRRKALETERKNYRPRYFTSPSFFDDLRVMNPVAFISSKKRNGHCSVCEKSLCIEKSYSNALLCDLCPSLFCSSCAESLKTNSVASLSQECQNTNSQYFSTAYRRRILESEGKIWICPTCTREVMSSLDEEMLRLRNDRLKRMAFFSAVKIQANCLKLKARRNYSTLLTGIVRLQAVFRGRVTRSTWRKEFASTLRVLRIKNIEFSLDQIPVSDKKSTVSCIVTVMNTDRSIWRGETHGISQKQHKAKGKWNDCFTLHSNTHVTFIFTLHAKESETSSNRTIFLGQHVFDGTLLSRCFFTGKSIKCRGELANRSVDIGQRFHFLNKKTYGTLSFEIHPISNIDSKCGPLQEVFSVLSRKNYNAVFYDKTLHLSSVGMPNLSLPIAIGTHITWADEKNGLFKIELDQSSYIFTCRNKDDLHCWVNKLTGKYKQELENATAQFRNQRIQGRN